MHLAQYLPPNKQSLQSILTEDEVIFYNILTEVKSTDIIIKCFWLFPSTATTIKLRSITTLQNLGKVWWDTYYFTTNTTAGSILIYFLPVFHTCFNFYYKWEA